MGISGCVIAKCFSANIVGAIYLLIQGRRSLTKKTKVSRIMAMTNLSIIEQNGELVVDSRLIAERLGIQHEALMRTIRKYLSEVQEFGHLRFENGTVTNSVGAVNKTVFCFLNEQQASYLMTLSRNTDEVRLAKRQIVLAFTEAKKIIQTVIPAQSEHIQALTLINENLRMQNEMLARQDSMLTLHGSPVMLALAGKSDQIIEVEKPTLEVIDEKHNVRFEGQTLTQMADYIQSRYGIRFKSGADLKRALERLGGGGLVAQTPRTVTGDYVPKEFLDEAYRLLTNGDRQKLIGE